MNTTFVRQMGYRRSVLWAALLLCLSGQACFRTPNTSKIPCVAPSNCPNNFHCAIDQGATQGVCVPGPASADGSIADLSASPGIDGKGGGAGGGALGRDTNDAETTGAGGTATDASLGGAGGAGGATSGGSSGTGGTSTVDVSIIGTGGVGGVGGTSGSGGASTVDAPLAGAGGAGGTSTGGAGGAGTKLDAPAGTGGTTTLATGAKCTDDSQCTLGFCVDGVCCDSRCGGQCQACAETGSVGTCTTVQSGDPRGTRTPCTGTGKCKGQCDISSATSCKMPGNTTVCQAETCSLGQHTPESVCNGSGTCPGQTATTCSTGSCATDGSGKCLGACTSTSCPTGQYCASTGSCTPKKGNGPGNTCTTGSECTSNHCSSADGICCDTDCTGQCQTCSTGTCMRVASGQPVGGRAACAGSTDTTCGGRCDNSSDNCFFPPAGTSCLAATCTNSSTHQFAKTCPGSGGACASPTPPSETCSYGCTNGACATCTPNCTNKCSGPDGCNGTCYSTCPSGQSCGAVTANVCGCAPSCTNKCGGASDGCNGTCNGQCSGNTICQSGACQSCGSQTACGGACVNTSSDPTHCGSCTGVCGSGTPYCVNSACGQCRNIADCAGWSNCDSTTHSCVCKQKTSGNKLLNPGLDVSSGLASWQSSSTMADASYSTADAEGCPGSGSIYLPAMAGFTQCVNNIGPSVSYEAGYKFNGTAYCGVDFYSAMNCSGFLSEDNLGGTWTSSNWLPVGPVPGTTPANTQSVQFYCGGGASMGNFDEMYFNTGGGTF